MMKTLGIAMVVLVVAAWVMFAGGALPPAQPARRLHLDLGNGMSVKLALIPSGKFLMGSPETEKDREADEPQHEVTISKPFYMGITPVTVDQFASFVKESGYRTDAETAGQSTDFAIRDGRFEFRRTSGGSWRKPSFDQTGDHPVLHISWNDAKAFCHWLSKKTGRTVMLPTEAQWEYASRAGTKTAYLWGDNPDDGKGWINGADQSLKGRLTNPPVEMEFFNWDDGFVFTSPVGSFKTNAFGLHDMTGNVWQWCEDLYGPYGKGPAVDPKGTATGSRRVLRGGSWMFHARYCRSAGYRNYQVPEYRDGRSGFRVAVLVAGVD